MTDVWIYTLLSVAIVSLISLIGVATLGIAQVRMQRMLFFVLERGLLWHHSHSSHKEEVHAMVYLTIIGDALHNFLDGVAIAAAFLVSIPIGVATATAVIFHEIP